MVRTLSAQNTRSVCVILLLVMVAPVFFHPVSRTASAAETSVAPVEGLADPNSEAYSRDKGFLLDDLCEDARRQVIDKAVGVQVDSSTLVENYTLIHDCVLNNTSGLIKQVIKESEPWIGKDRFAHMLIKAEVYLTDVRNALEEMSGTQKIALIKQRGNSRILVATFIGEAERGSDVKTEGSPIAKNIMIKKELIGLRSILNVDLREFDESGISLYEVEFAGGRAEFSQFLDSNLIKPLNTSRLVSRMETRATNVSG